ncbi:RloB family protein [Cupriavidus plantarum]|uniref:RloB family protein n=1 Tax=Cupriavidus plantarum TaxID=942865 RepID=UPI00339D314A
MANNRGGLGRSSGLERKGASRTPKHGLILVVEGEITEVEYIHSLFAKHGRNSKYTLIRVDGGEGSPDTIVKRCIELTNNYRREKRRDKLNGETTVWAVFDVDAHTDLDAALNRAHANDINYVLSNPCFEIWGLMHERICDRPMSRQEAQAEMRAVLPSYHHDKNPRLDWGWCCDRVSDAVGNSRRATQRREEEGKPFPQGNPSTNFHDFVIMVAPELVPVKGKKN